MKVDSTQSSSVSKSQTRGTSEVNSPKKNRASVGAKAVEQTQNDDVKTEISSRSRDFARVKNLAQEAPDVREDRVASLKQRIAEGKYQVDHGAVADRLVDDHLKMSGMG